MKLRDYQAEAVDAIWDKLDQHSSTLLVMATGTGKTISFAHAIKRCEGRALVIAHREELIFQACDKIEKVIGERPEIEMGSLRADQQMFRRTKVIVASKDTLHPKRLERFKPDQFSLIITDEAHHAVAATYRRIYEHFDGVPHLGVTATPDRADEEALGQIFESVAFEYGIEDAIRDGWLVPIRQQSVHVHDLDFSQIKTTAGDLNTGELSKVMQYEKNLHAVVDPTIRLAKWRRTLIFAVSVAHAERLAEIIHRHRAGSSRFVCGSTPRDERERILTAFKNGKFQFLVNVGVFTEGFDEPGIEMVVMARKTKSRSLYAQMIGRGTRPVPGLIEDIDSPEERCARIANSAKPNVTILDFVGNSGRHKLVSCADVLGGRYPDEVVELAERNTQQSGEPEDVTESLRRAETQIHAEKKRKLAEVGRQQIKGKASYSTTTVDPFGVLDIEPEREVYWHRDRKPTEKQVAFLAKTGIKKPEQLTFTQAGRLCKEVIERRAKGLCTYKQARVLGSFGYDPDVTFEQAGEIITEIANNNWHRPEAVSA